MKRSGRLVKHLKTGKIGKVYNDNSVMNNKVVVYFDGEDKATLCEEGNINIIGYFD